MNVINHKIEDGQHASTSITEVTDASNLANEPDWKSAGITDVGFYFWDETEAYATGPYKTLKLAIEKRDEYFRSL